MHIDNIDAFAYAIGPLNKAMQEFGVAASQAAAAFLDLAIAIRNSIPKEKRIIMNKIVLMKARLQTLEGRNTDCEAIRKKLRRQIRNLEAALAA